MVGLAMILIGLGFKVSAVPFQVWTPDVYEGAPPAIVGLMSTAPKAAAFAVLLRILYSAFPAYHANWVPLIWIMAALSMTIGNLGALRQQNVKRMLAYSSIAHAGYMLVAFAALSADGIAAASFYTASYAAMNVGVFAVVSHVAGREEKLASIADYRGLAYRSPLLGAVLAFFLISLIGIPFTGGFFGKFYVFAAALHSGLVWLAILGLFNSGIAAFYYLRLVTSAYSQPSDTMPVGTARQSQGAPPHRLAVHRRGHADPRHLPRTTPRPRQSRSRNPIPGNHRSGRYGTDSIERACRYREFEVTEATGKPAALDTPYCFVHTRTVYSAVADRRLRPAITFGKELLPETDYPG